MKKLLMLLLVSIMMASTVHAAAFMKLGDIKGESKDRDHEDWIIIQSLSQEMSTETMGATGSARARASPTLGDIVVTKELDKSSPKLQEAIATGKVIPKMEVEFTRNGVDDGRRVSYYVWELKNVMISSYEVSADADNIPTETLSLNYEEIKVTYKEQKDDGTIGDIVEWIFNLVKGR